MREIESWSNPKVKMLRRIAKLTSTRKEGRSMAVGIQPVSQLLTSNVDTDFVLVCAEKLAGHPFLLELAEFERRGGEIYAVPAEICAGIAGDDGRASVVACFMPPPPTSHLQVSGDRFQCIATAGITNPGNLGTIMRTAEAAGASAVIMVGKTCDPWAPAVARASMGALFNLDVVTVASVAELREMADDLGAELVATSGQAEPLVPGKVPQRLIWLMGPEQTGLTDDELAQAHRSVALPMQGNVDSLNVAVAAGVLLYQWRLAQPSA